MIKKKGGSDFGTLHTLNLNLGFAIHYRLILTRNLTVLGFRFPVCKWWYWCLFYGIFVSIRKC